jgi:hypothetical protein
MADAKSVCSRTAGQIFHICGRLQYIGLSNESNVKTRDWFNDGGRNRNRKTKKAKRIDRKAHTTLPRPNVHFRNA